MTENVRKLWVGPRYSRAYIVDRAILVFLCTILIIITILYSGILTNGAPVCADFMGFYAAGKMGARGELARAYDAVQMNAEINALCGRPCPLSWVHPPSFGLIVIALSYLPVGVPYFLFVSITLLGYLFVLRRLSTDLVNYNLVRIACLPAIVGVIVQGQTGFLTGALVGFFCIEAIQMRARAGIPLGLMIIKPHLALGIAVFCLLKRQWAIIGVAGATCSAIVLFATFFFGFDIWPAFASGIAEISRRLVNGDLPLAKMASIYSSFASFGLSSTMSSWFQLLVSFFSLFIIVATFSLKFDTRVLIGISIVSTFGLSPYFFFYDWTVASVGLTNNSGGNSVQ